MFTTKCNDSPILITIISWICRWRMQGRLNSIIDPREKQCTGALPKQPLAGIKMQMVDKIKHIFVVLVLPINSVFKH